MLKKGILIAFGELFLKSKGVKDLFQKRLVLNSKLFLKKQGTEFKIHSFRERIFIETEDVLKASRTVKNVFGIAWFSECFCFDDLKPLSLFVSENYKDWIKSKESFAIRTKSKEAIDKIAKIIDRKVDLSKPDKELFLEQRKDVFLYFKKKRGKGGLPVGSSGKVLTLMSGGIDSPVASYLIAKRGAENIWVHFHSFPLVSKKSIEKTTELAEKFLKYQTSLKVYFVPFQDIQLEIKAKVPEKYRILLYRRLMFKIAERIAKKEDCLALVTGESLGQVSSQTLDNIEIIQDAVKIPIFRPLIEQDKEEIIKTAKKIGTFNISIKPQEDCCSLFVPRHATAKGDLKLIKDFEKKLNNSKITKGIEIKVF